MEEIRSFISIDVEDGQVLSEIGSVVLSLKGLGADLKAVEPENIHLTLKFLGNVNSTRLVNVRSSLSSVSFPPFRMEIKGAGAFPSLRRMNVVWVGIGEGWTQVQQVYERTENALVSVGFARESRGFSPHITIARVRSARRVDEMGGFLRKLEEKSFGAFTASFVRLKQSVLSSSGPKYSTLLEVPTRTS